MLHLLPENGTIERFSFEPSSSTNFRYGGAIEKKRDQIGTVTLPVRDGETARGFLNDVEIRICKLWKDFLSSNPAHLQAGGAGMSRLVQDVLKPAALGAIHDRERPDHSMNVTQVTQTYPVFGIEIKRSRVGRIETNEPTRFPY